MLAGRAYGGHSWESAPPELVRFSCGNGSGGPAVFQRYLTASANTASPDCTIQLPNSSAVRYQITVFDYANETVSNRSAAARFLMRTTFGPTRRAIDTYLTEYGADPAAWLAAQVASPPTLLRAWWRKRVNPRIHDAAETGAGQVRSACSNMSRWSRFAFNGNDNGSPLEVASAGDGFLRLSVRGELRTVVPASLLDEVILDPPELNRSYSTVHQDSPPGTGYAQSRLTSNDAWLAARLQDNTFAAGQWMQIDLGAVLVVSGVVTMGRKHADWYMARNLTVSTSTDGASFSAVPGTFENLHGNLRTVSRFAPIAARFVRFLILDYFFWPSLRAGVVVNGLNMALTPYTICKVDEWVGGGLTVGHTCSLMLSNPAVAFRTGHTPPADRMVATVQAGTDLASPAALTNMNSAGTDVFLLPQQGVAWGCDSGTPQTGPLFASIVDTGASLVNDRRVAIAENTLENPAEDSTFEASTRDGSCATVPRTFLNAHTCVIGQETCAAKRYTSATFTLNETMVRQFYVRGGKFVYIVNGLRLESDAASPCSGTSRWVRRGNDPSACDGQVNAATLNIIAAAVSSDAALGSDRVRDVVIDGGAACSADAGVSLLVGDSCWQHVHEFEHNVYDFSTWTSLHNGNLAAQTRGRPAPISKWALRGSPAIHYPAHHPVYRFVQARASHTNGINLLGRLGDEVDFLELPTSVQVDAMAELVGADSVATSLGDESCGSPGEVANDPRMGAQLRYQIGTYEKTEDKHLDRDRNGRLTAASTKYVVWHNVVLSATDQLRQRMAWTMSQIFVTNVDGAGGSGENHLNYYDIFVRNAFGNFRDIIKEVHAH